jgi:hypothetical protein
MAPSFQIVLFRRPLHFWKINSHENIEKICILGVKISRNSLRIDFYCVVASSAREVCNAFELFCFRFEVKGPPSVAIYGFWRSCPLPPLTTHRAPRSPWGAAPYGERVPPMESGGSAASRLWRNLLARLVTHLEIGLFSLPLSCVESCVFVDSRTVASSFEQNRPFRLSSDSFKEKVAPIA